jgi:hypothetical protein
LIETSESRPAGIALGRVVMTGVAGRPSGQARRGSIQRSPLTISVLAIALFVLTERRQPHPMLPPGLFRSAQFSATNLITFVLYAANGAVLLLVIELQTVSGFTPLVAGTALLPITIVMLLLAARFGAWAQPSGPRLFIAAGLLVSAAGLAMMTRLNAGSGYWAAVLPAVTVVGLGLAVFVAPLTAIVLGAVSTSHAGVASGVNNGVARAASLLAIAALPATVGLTGDVYQNAARFLGPFREAMWICVGMFAIGAVLSTALIRDRIGSAR